MASYEKQDGTMSFYGGVMDDLHPFRHEVVDDALRAYERGEASRADMFVLWADVVINHQRCELGRLREEAKGEDA